MTRIVIRFRWGFLRSFGLINLSIYHFDLFFLNFILNYFNNWGYFFPCEVLGQLRFLFRNLIINHCKTWQLILLILLLNYLFRLLNLIICRRLRSHLSHLFFFYRFFCLDRRNDLLTFGFTATFIFNRLSTCLLIFI